MKFAPRSYAAKHKLIAELVCCPACKTPLRHDNLVSINDIPAFADVVCPACGYAGELIMFKYRMLDQPAGAAGRAAAWRGRSVISTRPLEAECFLPGAHWKPAAGGHYCEQKDDRFWLQTSAVAVALRLLRHSWSGIVTVRVDGRDVREIDLYEEIGSVKTSYEFYLGQGSHTVELVNTGRRNPASAGQQVWVYEATEMSVDPAGAPDIIYEARNAGNPYPAAFRKHLAELPADAVILDCGSGDRCFDDPRIINFEYTRFFAPDVFGDGHRLPFKDNSFDYILSQAVFEHLYDPFQAAREIIRVLKPGGLVYCESAFMQPLHAVPYHYFNTTVWGVEELFKATEKIETSYLGNMSDTIEWVYRLTALREKGMGEQLDQLIGLARELDRHVTRDELKQFASFVSYLGRKRHA